MNIGAARRRGSWRARLSWALGALATATVSTLSIGCDACARAGDPDATPTVQSGQASAAPPATQTSQPAAPVSDGATRWTASHDLPNGERSLETATRTYTKDGCPSVSLVGVAHVGEADYYRGLKSILDTHDLVLYESVYPSGARAPCGRTPDQRVAATKASMKWFRDQADATWRATGSLPTVDAIVEHARAKDSRAGAWVKAASVDAWGQPLNIIGLDKGFSIVSLGADGRIGGAGESNDLRLLQRGKGLPPASDGIQRQLADLLRLNFQLDTIDYSGSGWIVCDMTAGELQAAFDARGITDGPIQDSLRGGGIASDAAVGVVALLRLVDAATGGAARETVKMIMVEVLSSDAAIDGEALADEGLVILGDRNELLYSELMKRVNAGEQAPKRIAVFYGAAHMADLHKRLTAMGFVPGEPVWSTALRANPRASGLDDATMVQFRKAVESASRARSRGDGAAARTIAPAAPSSEGAPSATPGASDDP